MTNRGKLFARVALLTLLAVGLASCAGGGMGFDPLSVALFNFSPGFGGVHLNAPLELTFTAPVDPASITSDSIRIFTTTTTTAEPDPGAPAQGVFVVIGNVVRFLPNVPCEPDLSDAGLRIGFTYTIQVPAAPDVIEPVRTIEGDPNVVSFVEFFSTKNHTILPAPGDITAEPNLNTLSQFFIDEGIENGVDPCPRPDLPVADRDSPQVIDTDPDEGESGFGTITGIQAGLGTAFVRLDPITIEFSEPVGPWRIRPQNIQIRNTNLGGETFDLFFFFTCSREETRLQITVFDADSAFDQASVPQGRYVLSFTDFTDLAGNPLVNSGTCTADGTFQLSFSTVSSPTLPTDMTLTFQDDDQEGHVDVGGLDVPTRDINIFPEHQAPFLGGVAIDQPGITVPSPSNVTTTANWGSIGFQTGAGIRFDNGLDQVTMLDRPIPAALRLRGGSNLAATPIMAPIAGFGNGRSSTSGSLDGSVAVPGTGKVDFERIGFGNNAALFTGDATTGPIIYQYRRFRLEEDATGRPVLTALAGSIFPMIILVEEDATITGDVILDGGDGDFGFNGANDGSDASLSRTVGGAGGTAGPGGGVGGNGGSFTYGGNAEQLNGETGGVPANVLGPLDQLSEAVAGIGGMAPGGGGHYDASQTENNATAPFFTPNYQGGGGASYFGDGTPGNDLSVVTPGETDQGVGGNQYGIARFDPPVDFGDPDVLAAGGAGGGGGGADDDGADDINWDADGNGNPADGDDRAGPDAQADSTDDGGGGGGGGGGFFGLSAGGDITIGAIDTGADPMDPADDTVSPGLIRCVGGRGGSTYSIVDGDPPVPGPDAMNPDITTAIGQGNAGGGGGGGSMALTCGGNLNLVAGFLWVFGKRGGNSPTLEAGGRIGNDQAGDGAGGLIILADSDGVDLVVEILTNDRFIIDAVTDFDVDEPIDGGPDLVAGTDDAAIRDIQEMSGPARLFATVYGDEQDEPLFGTTRIVTEFFDTLSDAVSYDEVRVLSNAPRFPYSVATESGRTIQVNLDVTGTVAGLPDLTTETLAGAMGSAGTTIPIGLHFDQTTGANLGAPQYDSRALIPAGTGLGRRFARVRIAFDLSLIGGPAALLGSFAPPGAPAETIADDLTTIGVLDNSLGNTDSAPAGVPAVAEVRVRFTP